MLKKNVLVTALLAILVSTGVYFYEHRKAPAEIAAEPVAAAVVAPAAPAFIGPRSKPEAIAALMALPELKAWSEFIKLSSKGASHGALIEYGPTPKTIGSKRYWQLSYVENTPDAAHRWDSFLVGENNPEILVEDAETDQPISLEQWRKEKQPLARIGGQ